MGKYCECDKSVYCGFNPVTCLHCGKPNRDALKHALRVQRKLKEN